MAINTTALIDGLLKLRSDFCSFIHQIDQLVQVLKLGGENSGKGIESLMHVFSEIHELFKPWVPKFQKALFDLSEQSQTSEAVLAVAEHSMCGSLVSTSPLVSWGEGCTAESGREFFLLTPSPPRDVSSSECQRSSKRFKSCSDVIWEMDVLHVRDEVKSIPDQVSSNDMFINKVTLKEEFFSPEKLFQRDSLLLVITSPQRMSSPKSCVLLESLPEHNRRSVQYAGNVADVVTSPMIMSPPKTCVLLEPLPEHNHRVVQYAGNVVDVVTPPMRMSPPKSCVKLEPFPEHNCRAVQYAGNVADVVTPPLRMSPPKSCVLLGTLSEHNHRAIQSMDSPIWLISPPKSCVLLEPTSENLSTNAAGAGGNLDIVESTPVMTESGSILKKRSEDSLKKELWTKFNEATTDIAPLKMPANQNTQKSFLQELEDIIADEPHP